MEIILFFLGKEAGLLLGLPLETALYGPAAGNPLLPRMPFPFFAEWPVSFVSPAFFFFPLPVEEPSYFQDTAGKSPRGRSLALAHRLGARLFLL